jgi:hypothetical protein
MKYIYILFLACLLFQVNGQKSIDNVFQKQRVNVVPSDEVRNNINSISSSQLLYLNDAKAAELFNASELITFQVPTQSGTVELEIERASIFSPNFKVMTPSGEATDIELPHYYHGKIKGDANSFVALMITKDAIEGMITNDKLNLTIGRVKGVEEKIHAVYNTNDILNTTPICSNPIELDYKGKPAEDTPPNGTTSTTCRALEVYLEADNQMYLDLGSTTQAVINHMTAIFNNVSLLYDNEGVDLVISTLFVWTIPDPYGTATNTSQSLNLLNAYWNGQGNNFDGDIVQMVTTKNLGGGIAYLLTGTSVFNGMTQRAVFSSCGKGAAKGMSANIRTSVVNFPTYSWNVMVIAHEIGHNCGLPHTHSCTWSDGTTTGAIDNCATTEGNCAGGPTPTNGGTIMSYCHGTTGGTNFANGFGPLPGGKLRAEINAASCLMGSIVAVPVVANVSICATGQTAQLTATGCTGTYEWFNAAVNGISLGTQNPFTTPALTMSTNYFVSCTQSGCTSRRNQATVFLTNIFTAPIVQDIEVCSANNTATLTATCNGLDLKWYSAVTNGTLLGSGNNFALANVLISRTVYAECSSAACGASPRAALQITLSSLCPYCEPSGLNCSDDDMITQIKIDQGATNLYTNNSVCSASGFTLYTPATPVVFVAAQRYKITTKNPGIWPNGLAIWLDYNRNGVFETSEKVESYDSDNNLWMTRETNVAIPAMITAGVVRMRVKVIYFGMPNDPCSSSEGGDGGGFGEIEDYIITLSAGGTPCPPSLIHTTGILSAGDYNAEQTIISQANVGTLTNFQAGSSIVLDAGFQAGPSEVFEANIAGCPE